MIDFKIFGSEFEVKDHSVSGETFRLVFDDELEMYKTEPHPNSENLPKYYKSEDYISHTDEKRNLLERGYHFVRSIALKKKLKLINSYSDSGKKLLDVGCGTGDFLKTAQDDNWKIEGLEPDAGAREIANKKANNKVLDIDRLWDLSSEQFDVITLWHVFEHLPDLEKHISTFNKILKPNGRLIIAVPNYKSWDAQYYKSHWAAFDVPRHLWHFSSGSIKKLFFRNNLEVEKILPMKFDSFYVSLLSEKYKNGWMNPLKAFYVGLSSNIKAKSSGEFSSLIYVIKKRRNRI